MRGLLLSLIGKRFPRASGFACEEKKSVARRLTISGLALLLLVNPMSFGGTAAESTGGSRFRTNGPYGGSVKNIAVDPFDSSVVLAATGNGLFKSEDGGSTWQASLRGLKTVPANAVVFDPSIRGLALVMTGGGIYRSTDSGSTWVLADERVWGSEIVVGAVPQPVIYVSGRTPAVYVSTDHGLTWSRTYFEHSGISAIATSPTNSHVVYAAGYRDRAESPFFLSSSNRGVDWTSRPAPGFESIAVHPIDSETIYGTSDRWIKKSTDGGDSWETIFEMSDEYEQGHGRFGDIEIASDGRLYASGLRFGPSGSMHTVLFASDIFGENWTHKASFRGMEVHMFQDIEVDPIDPNVLYLAPWEHGLYKTTDGGNSFTPIIKGLMAAPVHALGVDPNQEGVYYASLGTTLFRTDDGGESWLDVTSGLELPEDPLAMLELPAVAVDSASNVYVARLTNRSLSVLKSTDQGASWSPVVNGLPERPTPSVDLVAHPKEAGSLLLAHQDDYARPNMGGIYKTTDSGEEWKELDLPEAPVVDIAVAGDSEWVAAVAASPDPWMTPNHKPVRVYSSGDFGETWSWNDSFETKDFTPLSVGIGRGEQPPIFVGDVNAKFARSFDGGASWEFQTVETRWGERGPIRAIDVDPYDLEQLLMGMSTVGILVSRDEGATWEVMAPGYGRAVYVLQFVDPPPPEDSPPDPPEEEASVEEGALGRTTALAGVQKVGRSGLWKITLRPHSMKKPYVTGIGRVGETLRCHKGEWSRATTFEYKWLRNSDTVKSGRRYWVRRSDKGNDVSCRVVASGPGGRDGATSEKVRIR